MISPVSGLLRIVATPIGNLDDLTPRAREALASADLIACEDTRHTGSMLARLGIDRPPLLSLHEHNERQRLPTLLARLEEGATVALVSDAGTPLLSDPGFPLVREAIARGVRVEALPGASALLTALAISGLPPLPFTFLGFPPPKSGKRRGFFDRVATLDHTLVVYESPHRIAACLADALDRLGPRPAVLARELTKLHEETLRGTLAELVAALEARGSLKGEIVLVIGGATAGVAPAPTPTPTQAPPARLRRHLRSSTPPD